MENILRKLAEAKGPQYTDTLKRQFLQKVGEEKRAYREGLRWL